MTREKLYYQDNHLTTFTATVEECIKEDGRYAIGLDRTAFYPEGGGQPCDRGFIGDIPVTHVVKGQEGPVHYTNRPLEPGTDVICRIDGDRRFDFMQQHTGQHIISALLLKEANGSTQSVHLGEDYVSIELDLPYMEEARLILVEREINRVINRNIPVKTLWTTEEDLSRYPIRRPSKVSGEIRLVQIEGVDCVPCGGIHTSTTGDVGLILYLGQEKIRGHVRTLWKIGERAYSMIRLNQQILSELGTKYAVPPQGLVKRLEILEKALILREEELQKKKETLLDFYLKELRGQIDKNGILTAVLQVDDMTLLQNAALSLLEEGCHFLALVNRQGENLQWIIGTKELNSFEFSLFKNKTLPLIKGKGGGRGPIWQGKGENREDLDIFFKAIRENYAK